MRKLLGALVLALGACTSTQITPAPPYDIVADVRRLSDELPLGAPVQLWVGPIDEPAWGLTEFHEDHWLILLDPRGGQQLLRDTLIHEWAHALVANGGGPCEDDHGPLWGVMYAACYRCVVERDE